LSNRLEAIQTNYTKPKPERLPAQRFRFFLFMNYRKYYEEYFNVKLPKDFDVHHIDSDRSNNHIENLVAIPKALHTRYHQSVNQFHFNISESDLLITFNNCNVAIQYYLSVMENINNSLIECFDYIVYRDILLNKKPLCILTIKKPY